MTREEFTVHIVDDNAAVRASLDLLLQASGFSTRLYAGPFALLNSLPVPEPGCLVLDVQMRGMSGLDLLEHLRGEGVGLPVIVMTGLGEISTAVRATRLGALEFLEKPFGEEALLSAIMAAKTSSGPSHPPAREPRQEIREAQTALASLSTREKQVLVRLAEGLPQKIIAHELGISARTVEVHRARMLRRLGTRHLARAIRIAVLAELAGQE